MTRKGRIIIEPHVFEQGKLSRTYLKLALPVVFGMVISIVYNIADTYFIARTQNTYLVAGVSLCGPIFTILMAFGNIFGQGGSSLFSRLLGQQDRENVERVSSFCFYGALAFGGVIMVLMLVFRGLMLSALGAVEDTMPYAREYYTVMAIGAPFVVLSFIHMNLLRCEGMSVESMVGSIVGLGINIILDPIFISARNMGAFGAALASVIGYIVSDLFLLGVVIRKSTCLSINPRRIAIPRNYIGQIFSVGTAAAASNWMSSLAMIVLNHFLLPYGNDKIAAMGIAQKIYMIGSLVIVGLSFGGAPLIGYFYGAGKKEKLKELLKFMLLFVGGTALVLALGLIATAGLTVPRFLKQPEIVADGVLMLRMQVVTMVLTAGILISTISFQASGQAGNAMILSLSRQGIVFLIVIVLAARVAGYYGVVCSQAVADLLSAGLAAILFYKDFYKKYMI